MQVYGIWNLCDLCFTMFAACFLTVHPYLQLLRRFHISRDSKDESTNKYISRIVHKDYIILGNVLYLSILQQADFVLLL